MGKQAESWAAELKARDLQTVDIATAIGACLQRVWHIMIPAKSAARTSAATQTHGCRVVPLPVQATHGVTASASHSALNSVTVMICAMRQARCMQ